LRHILVQSDDHDFSMVTFVCGLLMGELGWMMYYWLITYKFNDLGLAIPQMAVAQTLVMFLFMKAYKSLTRHDGKIKVSEVVMPAIFSGLIIIVMLLWFSEPVYKV